MRSGIRLCLIGMILFLLAGLCIVLVARPTWAQSREPRCVHNVCVTNCLVYQYILAGKPNFYAWYTTAYQLTGCGDSGWTTIRDLVVDVASGLVGAPGGYTMQCWQMMLGQASVCSDQCNDFFVKDCRYAPNVRASLVNPQPGFMTVKVENRDPSGGLPEYAPSAFSRRFNTYVYASRAGGQKILIDVLGIPSLSYPTWVNDANYTECVGAYNDTRCSMIWAFLAPNQVSLDVSWGGGIYDMSGLTKDARGLDSHPSSGYIALKHDADRVTIRQGNYSGYSYVWENNVTNGTISETVTPWNASGGDRSFTNREYNCWWCIFGDRIDRDTYVFITEGPPERLLTGQ